MQFNCSVRSIDQVASEGRTFINHSKVNEATALKSKPHQGHNQCIHQPIIYHLTHLFWAMHGQPWMPSRKPASLIYHNRKKIGVNNRKIKPSEWHINHTRTNYVYSVYYIYISACVCVKSCNYVERDRDIDMDKTNTLSTKKFFSVFYPPTPPPGSKPRCCRSATERVFCSRTPRSQRRGERQVATPRRKKRTTLPGMT